MGKIMQSDYEKVSAFYRQYHPFLHDFMLISPGGDVAEATKIGRLFRKYLIGAWAPKRKVDDNGGETFFAFYVPDCDSRQCICASACALMWFGAVKRFGSVGLHRPRADDPSLKTLGPTEWANAYREALDSIRQYLDEMEAPKPMIEAMVATGSADIKWVDADDDRLRRPPSLAEWEDATCGSFSSEDKSLLDDLDKKRRSDTPLTPREKNLLHQLSDKQSQWRDCQIELLSSNRDKLPPP
jgi:hypothetical protein